MMAERPQLFNARWEGPFPSSGKAKRAMLPFRPFVLAALLALAGCSATAKAPTTQTAPTRVRGYRLMIYDMNGSPAVTYYSTDQPSGIRSNAWSFTDAQTGEHVTLEIYSVGWVEVLSGTFPARKGPK